MTKQATPEQPAPGVEGDNHDPNGKATRGAAPNSLGTGSSGVPAVLATWS
jgi:hypothetical protein